MLRILFIFCSLLVLEGCRDNGLTATVPPRLVKVGATIHPERMPVYTRATDENTIADTNLYLFGRNNTVSLHKYTTGSRMEFECPPGDYMLYIVANQHKDIGTCTEQQLAALTFDYRENPADLPMSYAGEVTIHASDGTVELPAVEVRRQVAKIACNISVAKEVSDISLKSVCLYNVPRQGRFFGDGTPSAAAADYRTGGCRDIPGDAAAHYRATFYMPENRQGTVAGITSQRDKNRDNAPVNASYLMIRAVRGEKVLAYRVYLGENNTSDFNVRGNTHHTLNIAILGDDEVDTRVCGYTLSVWDDLAEDACGGYCPVDPQRSLYIAVEGNKDEIALSGEMEITGGDAECVEFHRIGSGSYFDFEVWKLQGESSYEMSYFPEIVTQDNDLLCYTVTVQDEYGYGQSYDFSHRYANEVKAYVKYGTVENGQGSVMAAGALASEKIGTTQNLRVMCAAAGCTLTAAPAAGYRFAGWYADYKFTRLLSERQSYTYVPIWFSASVYAKFEADVRMIRISTGRVDKVSFVSSMGYTVEGNTDFLVPEGSRCTISVKQDGLFHGFYTSQNLATAELLTEETSYSFTATEDRAIYALHYVAENLSAAGTANCYIAAKTRSGYKFNAHVMGNNKTTTGIKPGYLYGETAKVIWESGPTRGAVVKAVCHMNYEIYFSTGTSTGNALIGLFDSKDNCIWSWHIWVSDYDPAASAQTYTGGAVFMDRNLGALSPSGSNMSSCGLYYQWGRKDPFVYPSSGSSSAPYSVTYSNGYDYDVTAPEMGHGEMTVAYAVAHPWTFMSGVALGDDRYDDAPDWLSPQNPNLWGNASSSTALADKGSKSVYDPCPPGWRVPDRRTFSDAGLRKASSSTGYCLFFFSPATTTAYYPVGGYRDPGAFRENGKAGYIWTNAPAQYQTGTNYYKHYATALKFSYSGVEPLAHLAREKAAPVRCVRE